MKFLALAAHLLLVANAASASGLAARKKATRDEMRARNAGRRSSPFIAGTDIDETTVESSNWAGAAISTSGVTEVTGTFTVPEPREPSGGNSGTEYCGAAWVGIDGYSDEYLIQTGVIWCIEDGQYFYEAWYEYLPADAIEYSGISVTAGDVVTVTATKTGTNSGVTTLTIGSKTVSHTFSGESYDLPGTSAEWIVEDFYSGYSEVAFADFGTVTFTEASAIVSGSTVTPGGDDAVNIILEENGKALTSTTISGSTVTVTYE